MDDTLQNVAVGVCAFLALHFSLERRATQGAERQVREAFDNTGTVRVTAQPRGLFGYELNDVWAVNVRASHFTANRLPFTTSPHGGWKGHIRHLRLHFEDFTLFRLPIRRFEADVPFVTYDLGQAFYRSHLSARAAGQGPGKVIVGFDGLTAFATRKFASILSDVEIRRNRLNLVLLGRLRLFGFDSAFEASGSLVPRLGRYLDITDAVITLDGKPLDAAATSSLLQRFNPVLDLVNDVGLGGYFTLEKVTIGQGEVIIEGEATLPPASSPFRSDKR